MVGGSIQEVHADSPVEVILLDFDNEGDDKEISEAYVREILENPDWKLTEIKEFGGLVNAECGICGKKESILNATGWVSSCFVDSRGKIGPICPVCDQKWVTHYSDGYTIIRCKDVSISLAEIEHIPNLLEFLKKHPGGEVKEDI